VQVGKMLDWTTYDIGDYMTVIYLEAFKLGFAAVVLFITFATFHFQILYKTKIG